MGGSPELRLLEALNRARDPHEVGEAALDYALGRVPGAGFGFFLVWDGMSHGYRVVSWRGRKPPRDLLPAEPFGEERIIAGGSRPDLVESLGPFGSLLVFPVSAEAGTIAYLVVGRGDGERPFSRGDLRRLAPGWEGIVAAVRRVLESMGDLNALLERLPDAVLVVDGRGMIRGWNSRASELFGYGPKEVIGKPLDILVPQELKEKHRRAFARCVAEGREPRRFLEVEAVRRDGTRLPIQLALSRYRADGETLFIAVARDLTRILKAERELRESEQRFRALFERLPDAVYITSFDGTIIAANPQAAAQTGYTLEELVGMNIMRDIAAEEPAMTYGAAIERLRRGETIVFEEKKRRKDGSIFWTECAVTRIEYRGRPATLSINRDITERKRLERELQRRVKELEALISALRSVVSSLELGEVLRRITSLTGELVGAEYAVIALFDEKGELWKVVDRPMGLGPLPPKMRARGVTRTILETGRPVVVSEVNADGSTVPPLAAPDGSVIAVNPLVVEAGVKSFAGVPIEYKDRVVGILSVFSRRERAFDGRLPVLSALADVAAVAVENAKLYGEARHLFEESPVSLWVEDFSAVKGRLDSLRAQGVEDLAAYIRENPGFARECVELLRVVEVNRATLRLYRVRDLGELAEKLPALIPQETALLTEELRAIWEGRLEFEGVGTNRTAGGEPIHIHLRWRVFPGHEEDYSRVLVSIVDITDRVEAEKRLREHVEKLAALHKAVWRLQRCGTVEEVCREAVEGARGIMGFSVCNIGLVEGDWIRPVYTVGDVRPRAFRKGEGLVWRTLLEGRTFWGNVEGLPGARPVDPRIKSLISVPIGNIGVLQAASFEPDAFSEEDVKLAEILAGHVSEEIRRVRLEEELRERAIRDPLTGLYNRGHLMEVLEEEIRRAGEEGRSLAVLVTDLDNFKLVNDRFGHPFGDEVLREVARILSDTVGESGLVFRYGGDEFVVLLFEADGKPQRMAAEIEEAVVRWARGKGLVPLGFGISVGMAIWTPEGPLSPEELLRRADRDLYRLKRGG